MDIKSKINKVTCTFLDPELENEYKKSEWTREKSKTAYIMLSLAFLATIGLIIGVWYANSMGVYGD